MKIKTSDLTGPALDWAVASIEKLPKDLLICKNGFPVVQRTCLGHTDLLRCEYGNNWTQGGVIIEREEIFLAKSILGGWTASIYYDAPDDEEYPRHRCTLHGGETPLIAAMRCYVASKLGDEVDVPDELVSTEE